MGSPEPFSTDKLPRPKGPYSQAVKAGGFLFVSGLAALDAKTGQPCTGPIEEQVRVTLENLRTLLREAGGSLADVVKTTVFLADMDDFQAMNDVYATFFPHDPPARTTIQAARLPMDFLVEIDAVAYLGVDEP
jgi:2-iminobutanoate/2-iminopropanoate deaminase